MFVYKPQVGDDDFDSFHLVNLENENSTLLIKDCVNDPHGNPSFILRYLL